MTRAQVRNLEERSAVWVAKHLVMAGRLIDLEPELAFQHALAASRRGGRLAAVREAVGLTAYAAGHYGEALREFRTFRRISGSNVHLPVMADCERGLGRPDRALDLARSEEASSLDVAGTVELAMVVSGARSDLGQKDAAVSALEIPQLDLHRAFSYSPRLFRAYADALEAAGRESESGRWRRQADVAAKALGIDDDLEPDIVDLGDDDEPVSVPVPAVADVLGATAVAEDVTDREVGGDAPAIGQEDREEIPDRPESEPGGDAGGGASEEEFVAAEEPRGLATESPDLDDAVPTATDEHATIEHAPVTAGSSQEESAEHTTTAPVAPLQTEMLFDLDDAEAVNVAPAPADTSEHDVEEGGAAALQRRKRLAPAADQEDVE